MALTVTFEQPLDLTRFALAFDRVVASADVLRTTINPSAPTTATVAAEPTSQTEIVELDRTEVATWATNQVRQSLDLATSCYRSVLVDHGSSTSWFIVIHHIATDASSMALLIERTIAAYAGDEPEVSHFYRWVESQPNDDDPQLATRRDYWTARSPSVRTGRVYRNSDRTTSFASRLPIALSSEDHDTITEALQSEFRLLTPELSLASLLLTTTAIYLHRLSGSNDFAIGVPVHHRNTPQAATLIGPTLGVYPVDVHVEPDDTHSSLQRRLARSLMTALGNAHPGLTPPGDYDAVVNVIPNAAPPPTSLESVARWIHAGAIDPDHTLRVQATRYGRTDASSDQVDIDLDLHHQVASADQRDRAPQHFANVLRAVTQAPTASIYAAPMTTADELHAIAAAETMPDFDAEPALVAVRLRTALRNNPTVVVEDDARSHTGDELWRWVAALADDLGSDDTDGPVGILLGRSIEAVVAVYACVVAGRAFVPLDPNQPQARVGSLVRRAGVTRTFQSADELARFAPAASTTSVTDAVPTAAADSDAYVLFTSGSTGVPKGVPITHRGLARYVEFAITSYFADGDAPPIAPLFTALTFDLTITSLFAPILAGGRLVVIEESGPSALAVIASRPDLTWAKATPSHLEVLLPLLKPGHELATLVVGGEAFRADLATRLLRFQPTMAIFNEYGPTEAVVGCMIHRVDPVTNDNHVAVPIGVPAPGVTLRVVDPGGQRVPLGTPGELWIAHPGVTQGSLDGAPSPSQSAPPLADESGVSVFVETDKLRFYRSGDLVERAEDLGLTYLGRIDEQIKVGGIRLDPAEVEQALLSHPSILQAAVRQWTPSARAVERHCVRCGLPSNVPGVVYDDAGVCNTCLAYDQVAPMAAAWFRSEHDLVERIRSRVGDRSGEYDCLHLLSGGKDSTYALYRLVELGFRPYALMLDNGFISDGAKDNVRRVAEDLDLDYEFATTKHMNAIFRDSLETHSDVCHGCYKTIYTLATNRAVELEIPVIITGLSRGQLFETRLIPGQFQQDRFDPDAIDRAVVEARKRYHRSHDLPNRLLDTRVFDTDDVFESIEYIDIYRYLDVELTEMLHFLETKTPWQRPVDTGRSSNCLVNVAGIHAHQVEQGYHNYAEPYAWDVRLGHKRRFESMAELEDPINAGEISNMLATIGYEPTPRLVLTSWFQVDAGVDRAPTPTELRVFLSDRLPRHAIPAAFVEVAELATTTNGKLDIASLPAPARVHRAAVGATLEPESELESLIISTWETVLALSPISTDDDFFALGGDSLAAVTMIVDLADRLGTIIREELAFSNTTPRRLARAISDARGGAEVPSRAETAITRTDPVTSAASAEPPPLSAGELSILFDQQQRPHDFMYNIGRVYSVAGHVDTGRLRNALVRTASRHEPLTWTYGSPRRRLTVNDAVALTVYDTLPAEPDLATELRRWQVEPFDLEHGPLLRAAVYPQRDGTTMVALSIHHVSGDHQSLDQVWMDLDAAYQGHTLKPLPIGYADFCAWQGDAHAEHRQFWETQGSYPVEPSFGAANGESDGYVATIAPFGPEQLRLTAGRSPVANATAAAAAAVSPYFAGPIVEVDLVTSTRDHDLACELVGYLLNPIPLVFDRPDEQRIDELATLASTMIGACLPHRSYPFANLVTDARRSGQQPPSGKVLVSYNTSPVAQLAGMATSQRMLFNGYAVSDLSFFVEPRETDVHLGLEYRGSRVDRATATLLLGRFSAALTAAVRSSALTANDLPAPAFSVLRGPALRETPALTPVSFLAAAPSTNGVAVEVADRELTGEQLVARATQIAIQLQRNGIGRGDRVAVRLQRSLELPVAVMGVMLAGASYVPVDPTYPADRIASTLNRSGAVAEITAAEAKIQPVTRSRPRSFSVSPGEFDGEPWADTISDARAAETLAQAVRPDDEAYLIFTSGSTGEANGVAVTHGQLAASTSARSDFYSVDPDRFLLLSSIAFDSSIVGLFWSLRTGATIVLPTETAAHDIDALAELFNGSGLSHVLCVPTLYDAILDRTESTAAWPAVVIVAGEACSPQLVSRHFHGTDGSQLVNEYGPTEATVWATAHRCSPTDTTSVPIGKPIAGTWLAISDPAGNIVPEGVRGELILGGPNVVSDYSVYGDANAAGAGAHSASDSRRFADAGEFSGLGPDVSGSVFRTGDDVVLINGDVHFLGRLDDQLNVGGARIEPAEIEAALASTADVASVVVVAVDVRPIDQLLDRADNGLLRSTMQRAAIADDPMRTLKSELATAGIPDIRLVAHLTGPKNLDEAALRRAVAALPPTHRPQLFRLHDTLPQLPNGKVDRAAVAHLPVELTGNARGSGGVALSATSLNEVAVISELFGDVLGIDSVNPNDSFFDLGGDSLRALELLRVIEAVAGVRLATSAIHNSPTPALLAAELAGTGARVGDTEPLADNTIVMRLQPKGDRTPTFALHNLGVDGAMWRPLWDYLGDNYPLYGIADPFALLDPFGDSYNLDHQPEIHETAARYVEHIQTIAPDGPINLIGFCLGGVFGYDVAQQLERAGREIENFIIVLDWHAPHLEYVENWVTLTRLSYRRSGQSVLHHIRGVLTRRAFVKSAKRRLEGYAVRIATRLRVPLNERLRTRRYVEDGIHRIHSYVYQPYDGRITVIRSTEDPRIPTDLGSAGWGDLVRDLDVTYVPGVGEKMLYEPNTAAVADVVRDALDRRR